MDSSFEIDISNRQKLVSLSIDDLRQTLLHALRMEQVAGAVLSISIVDNQTIHELNREHLQHDYPTDVISFPLEHLESSDWPDCATDAAGDIECDDELSQEGDDEADSLEAEPCGAEHRNICGSEKLRAAGCLIQGEIVASAEMAGELSGAGHWDALSELKLYLVHGMLHICGYDDLTPDEQNIMRQRERAIMAGIGLTVVYSDDATSEESPSPTEGILRRTGR
jgi:probable rRNA maturation factor